MTHVPRTRPYSNFLSQAARTVSVLILAMTVCVSCASRSAIVSVPRAADADSTIGSGIVPSGLLVEPRDGIRPLVRMLDRAQRTIFVTVYILSDQRIMRALERAAAQGVEVLVMLEPHPIGMGAQPVRVANLLTAAGVRVRWTRPGFALTHAKFLVIDDRLAVISTANLSRSAFSRDSTWDISRSQTAGGVSRRSAI